MVHYCLLGGAYSKVKDSTSSLPRQKRKKLNLLLVIVIVFVFCFFSILKILEFLHEKINGIIC